MGSAVLKRFVFLKNAFILTATSLLLRTVGIFFRVYLSNKIGAEGMGLYQLVFSIYILASTFASSGISTGVTRLVAEQAGMCTRRNIRRILRRAILVSLLIGIISTLVIFFGAKPIARYGLGDMRAVPALQILSLGLPVMGISSCLRGYFIARRRVSRSTNAQLIEQTVRILAIFLIIDRFASMGISAACAAVMIADTLAETASCLHLWIGYLGDRRRISDSPETKTAVKPRILRRLLAIAVPITAGRYLNTSLRTVENLLVPNCLTRFTRSRERALSEFGMLKGMAMPILFFPSSLLSAFSTLLIPEISEAAVLHQKEKVNRAVNQSLRITLLMSIPISGLFTLFSSQLGILIYNSREVGFLIGVLAPIMPFMYLESVVDGLLKGLDQQVSSLKYSVLDSVIRITAIVLIIPTNGIKGFLFIMIVSNILTSSLNIRRLLVITGVRMRWAQWVLKPLLAIATAGVSAYGLHQILSQAALSMIVTLVLLSAVVVAIYAVLLFLFGCLDKRDIGWLHPVGRPRANREADLKALRETITPSFRAF